MKVETVRNHESRNGACIFRTSIGGKGETFLKRVAFFALTGLRGLFGANLLFACFSWVKSLLLRVCERSKMFATTFSQFPISRRVKRAPARGC